MIQRVPTLIAESEKIHQDYELISARLQPDQRRIIEFRHCHLKSNLTSFGMIWSVRRSSECENLTDIVADVRHMLDLHGASTDSFKFWKRTNRYPLEGAIKGVFWLKRLTEVTEDKR